VAEPSFTSIVQSAGAENGSRSNLKFAAPWLVPNATPSTVIVRSATAVPSRRNCVPFSSARETRTSADAGDAPTTVATTSSAPNRTRRPTRAWFKTGLAGPLRPITRDGSSGALTAEDARNTEHDFTRFEPALKTDCFETP
jgi:hypothetical protein